MFLEFWGDYMFTGCLCVSKAGIEFYVIFFMFSIGCQVFDFDGLKWFVFGVNVVCNYFHDLDYIDW